MPARAMGKQGVIEALFDCLADWREVAADVRGRALNCGHFIPEEKPASCSRSCGGSGARSAKAPVTRDLNLDFFS